MYSHIIAGDLIDEGHCFSLSILMHKSKHKGWIISVDMKIDGGKRIPLSEVVEKYKPYLEIVSLFCLSSHLIL
jgi:hypothetical protein